MKQIISWILLLTVFAGLSGCNQAPAYEPYEFFYTRSEYNYGAADGVIASEIRTDISYQSISFLLGAYLDGPLDEKLTSPFPPNTHIVSAYAQDGTMCIVLSDSLAQFTGTRLILACACLAKTVMSMENISVVEIRCETQLLDGKKSILIDENTVILTDISTPTEPTSETE